MVNQRILVVCAHNDDQIIGSGGTLAEYSNQGKEIITVIFSYGEMSLPWLKKKIAIETRVSEAHESDKILGINKSYYLALDEGKFLKKESEINEKLKRIIWKFKPEKIFTHSEDDPHPDHRATFRIMNSILEEIKFKGDVYSFDIWNPIKITRRNEPRLVVDISKTFHRKIIAFKCHKSQKPTIFSLMWNIYFNALWNGMKNDVKYAEVFYRIK